MWVALLTCQLLGFGVLDRALVAQYAPYSEKTLRLDREVITWPTVSYEIRNLLKQKPMMQPFETAALSLEKLPLITFGMSDPVVEPSTGATVRTSCGRSDVYVNPRRKGISFVARRLENPAAPAATRILDGAAPALVDIGPEWTPVVHELAVQQVDRYSHIVLTTPGCVAIKNIAAF